MTYYAGDFPNAKANADVSRLCPVSSDRAQMMEQLGLPSSTRVDGLMTIFRCASNTSALRPRKLVSMLRAQRDDAARNAGMAAR